MSLINDLANAGIIEQQEAIELNKKIEKSGSSSKDVLEILYRFFMQKITGISETGSLFVSVGSAETQEDVNHHNKKNIQNF